MDTSFLNRIKELRSELRYFENEYLLFTKKAEISDAPTYDTPKGGIGLRKESPQEHYADTILYLEGQMTRVEEELKNVIETFIVLMSKIRPFSYAEILSLSVIILKR